MRKLFVIILLLLFLFASAEAAGKRKPRGKKRIGRRAHAVVRVTCPPCIQQGCPDKIIVISQQDQETIDRKIAERRRRIELAEQKFETEFASWLSKQPVMTPEAAAVLRETARHWHLRGLKTLKNQKEIVE
jgi:hypothetical protein